MSYAKDREDEWLLNQFTEDFKGYAQVEVRADDNRLMLRRD